MQHGMDAEAVARGAVDHLTRTLGAPGGVIVIAHEGTPHAAFNTPAMPWALVQ
jgi:isoaspartyl peptidase/L-asparaginase-like protein (Ntn-hydrolase superfamily)